MADNKKGKASRDHDRSYRHMLRRVVKAREHAQLTAIEVDALLGREVGTMEKWESGTIVISPYNLLEIAHVLRVSSDYLLTTGLTLRERHPSVLSVQDAVAVANDKVKNGSHGWKKNWSEKFSNALAILIANQLRPFLKEVTPFEDGSHQEVRAAVAGGFKKLDVGYATVDFGLALGVSIKSINFPDESSGRYTKNYSARDNELRAEAMDYHRRQPFTVLVGILFLPLDSCDEDSGDDEDAGVPGASSFAAAVRYFRKRAGRRGPTDYEDRFERFFIGLYDKSNTDGANDIFFDVMMPPPRRGRPSIDKGHPYVCLSLAELTKEILKTYADRNFPPFAFSDDVI